MHTISWYIEYRLDYLLYILSIALLCGIAWIYTLPTLFFVSIGIMWLHIAWLALQEIRERKIGNELFLVFATGMALWGGELHAILLVLFIMVVAHYIQLLIEHKTSHALEQLSHYMPTTALLYEQGTEKNIPLQQIAPDMHLTVKTGGRIPADGVIIKGSATLNEALLTGESMPKTKQTGDSVFAGSFILSGSIIFRVQRVNQETLFNRMTQLLKQASTRKARITLLTEKITTIFIPAMILLILLVWIMTRNLNSVITLLIFGSPLELSLIAPLGVLAGSIAAFKRGIVIRGGDVLEQLAAAKTILFDKTGTLTRGEPTIIEIKSLVASHDEREILHLAAIAESTSDHVIAQSILKKARDEGLTIPYPETYDSLVGHGVEMVYQGKRYFFGNKHYIEAPEHGNSVMPNTLPEAEIYSDFYLAQDGVLLGKISVMDTARPDARETIQSLYSVGFTDIILISGDRNNITQTIATQLGIAKAYGEAFPEDKLRLIEQLQREQKVIVMVGDGINDAAALKQAHVGIAMGAMGMEPAIEAADIVLMTNELKNIYFVRTLAQEVMRVIKQNLFFGFIIVHLLGVTLTLLHILNPIQAAFAHAISDIAILLNTTKLVNFSPPLPPEKRA